MNTTASSFRLANDEPFVFKDYENAASIASKRLNLQSDEDEDPEDIIKSIVAVKRKKYNDVQPKKKTRVHSTPVINSPIKSQKSGDSSTSFKDVSNIDDDIDWSDDGEFFRNVSLLETSKTCSPSPTKRARNVDSNVQDEDTSKVQDADSGAILPTDDDLDWSDCDTELNCSISKLDRSALQEISNRSLMDQSLSNNHDL